MLIGQRVFTDSAPHGGGYIRFACVRDKRGWDDESNADDRSLAFFTGSHAGGYLRYIYVMLQLLLLLL